MSDCKNVILKSYPAIEYSLSTSYLGEYEVKKGYNKIEFMQNSNTYLNNYYLKKGAIIRIYIYLSTMIAVETNNNNYLSSDFYINGNSLKRIDGRFYFNIIIDTSFYLKQINTDIYFPFYDSFTNLIVSANIVGTNYAVNREVQINNCKI